VRLVLPSGPKARRVHYDEDHLRIFLGFGLGVELRARDLRLQRLNGGSPFAPEMPVDGLRLDQA
jgi:hypothetical protein